MQRNKTVFKYFSIDEKVRKQVGLDPILVGGGSPSPPVFFCSLTKKRLALLIAFNTNELYVNYQTLYR